ncbi:MAG TPA: hypothetical protein VEU96_30950 [Bryobacteraceae bacterium]|nr:hypothetical protein [Bryobacteraceae bacterium]
MTPWLLIFALLNVIAVCPVVAGGMSEKSSCCPHSSRPQIPCTESTGRNCPYVLLENGKAERSLSVAGFDVADTPAIAELHAPERLSSLIQPEHLADSSGSYLLLRVLRL